jgi:hypothetical protein
MNKESADRKPDTLVCGSWSLEALMLLAGSKKGDCDFCGVSVVVSAEGQELLTKDPDLKICCFSCVYLHAPDDMDVKITTEVRAAAESAMGRDLDEFIAGSPKDLLRRARQAEERRSNS